MINNTFIYIEGQICYPRAITLVHCSYQETDFDPSSPPLALLFIISFTKETPRGRIRLRRLYIKYPRISWEIRCGWVGNGKDDVNGFSFISEICFKILFISMHELDGTARVICNAVLSFCAKRQQEKPL